jgi:4-amino-4-deoxy-L-arabinose transferase-like glycosyltransferase
MVIGTVLILSSIAEISVTKRRLRTASFIFLGVLAVLLWLRTSQPLLLPIYYDEALHIERAQRVVTEHTLLMGTEGGKYFQIWLLALVLPFSDNPLLAARVLSAVAGLLTAVGGYFLARHLYQRDDVALVSTFLYATTPYALFFDRMGMADGLLTTLTVWSLFLSLITIRQGRWWQILALGLCLGLTAATKLNGVLFLVFPLLAVWFWWGKRPLRQVLRTLLVAWLLAVPWLLPSLLDLSPQLKPSIERSWLNSAEKEIPHVMRLGHNLNAIAVTLWVYLTPPCLLLALIETGRSIRRREKASWLLMLAALITLTFFFLTAEVDKFFARYVLPAFPFLLILAARSLVALTDWLAERLPHPSRLIRSALLVGLVLLIGLPALHFDYLILTDPPQARWLARDRQLFVDGPLAGYGIIDAAAYLRQHADQQGMIIVVKRTDNQKRTGSWGYYLNRDNIILNPINLKYADPQELIQSLHNAPAPVFVVLDRPSEDRYAADFTDGPYAPYSTLVATFPRPGNASRIEVYRVQPRP